MELAIAICTSLAAIGWLAWRDPKRRRVFRQQARPETSLSRGAPAGWIVALAPGLWLALQGEAAGFSIWLAAASTLGWLIVFVSPDRWRALRDGLRDRIGHADKAATAVLQRAMTAAPQETKVEERARD